MNAGAHGQSIEKLVAKVLVMDYNGRLKTLSKKQIKFCYRDSNLGKYIVLNAVFSLKKMSGRRINNKIRDYLAYRKEAQDSSKASAGCVFKNSGVDSAGRPASPAGRLIDACGFKGKIIGGAQVSLKHANFIINNGKAKAKDVLQLMKLIKKQVKKKFNINLEPEIKILK